jgi:hypothetical protein
MAGESFLDKINVSDEERAKLRSLGAATPVALLGMRIASPVPFDQLFGTVRGSEIAKQLQTLLTGEERSLLQQPIRNLPPVSARITPFPQDIRRPSYDVAERDRLFAELQQLREIHPTSDDVCRRITEIEKALNALLSGNADV